MRTAARTWHLLPHDRDAIARDQDMPIVLPHDRCQQGRIQRRGAQAQIAGVSARFRQGEGMVDIHLRSIAAAVR